VTILRRQGGGVRDAIAKDGARSEQRATEEENETKKNDELAGGLERFIFPQGK
jgi:hypothetical protein